MTTFVLIYAGPTPWDVEKRIGGNRMLPLTAGAEMRIQKTVSEIAQPVGAVYTFEGNSACNQAAQIIARKFNLRPRNTPLLEPISLGLWQGLTREELRFRYPTVFPQWEEDPLSVNAPEGETIADAASRLYEGLRKIFRRNRGACIAIPTRPLSMQIIAGMLRGESLPVIASHLQVVSPVEIISVDKILPRRPEDD